jgi:MFS family permease
VTLLMQTTAGAANFALPVLAPEITAAAGVPHENIGYLAAISTVGTMWFLMAGMPMLAWLGSVRMLQLGGVVAAAAIALVATGWWPMIVFAAVLMGIGYGPSPPAGSDLLNRTAPPRHRALIFSVKQAGVPLGGAVCGVLLPAAAALWGWRWTLILTALASAAIALAIQPFRARFDDSRPALDARPSFVAMFSPARLADPLRAIRLAPGLASAAAAGICFAWAQGAIFNLYVTFLAEDRGFGLAAAGAAFAALQTVGVGARVAMGFLADRIGSARRTLILLALGSAALTAVTALVGADWPWPAVLAAAAAAGVTVPSWNGVFLAEVARLAPRERVGEATAGATFFCFIGYVVGPATSAALIAASGSYTLTFLVAAAFPLAAALALAFNRRTA